MSSGFPHSKHSSFVLRFWVPVARNPVSTNLKSSQKVKTSHLPMEAEWRVAPPLYPATRFTSSNTLTTVSTAILGAGSRMKWAKAGYRSSLGNRRGSIASSGDEIALESSAIGSRLNIVLKLHWTEKPGKRLPVQAIDSPSGLTARKSPPMSLMTLHPRSPREGEKHSKNLNSFPRSRSNLKRPLLSTRELSNPPHRPTVSIGVTRWQSARRSIPTPFRCWDHWE